jgi:transposase
VLVLHRMRSGFVEQRTAPLNRLHGELFEFGVFLPQGIDAFRDHFVKVLEDGTTELDGIACTAVLADRHHIYALDEHIAWCDSQIAVRLKHDTNAQRLTAVVGIGPLTR